MFLSQSNYLHPLTCCVSLKLCMARLSCLLLFFYFYRSFTPPPTTATHRPHCTVLYCFTRQRHQSYNLQLSVASHLSLSMFLSRIVSPSFSSCVVIAILFFCLFNSLPHRCPSLTIDFFLPFFLRQDTFKSFTAIK